MNTHLLILAILLYLCPPSTHWAIIVPPKTAPCVCEDLAAGTAITWMIQVVSGGALDITPQVLIALHPSFYSC
jgi:hypothetical protein